MRFPFVVCDIRACVHTFLRTSEFKTQISVCHPRISVDCDHIFDVFHTDAIVREFPVVSNTYGNFLPSHSQDEDFPLARARIWRLLPRSEGTTNISEVTENELIDL